MRHYFIPKHFVPELVAVEGEHSLANGTLTGHQDDDGTRIRFGVGRVTAFTDGPIRFLLPDGTVPDGSGGPVAALDAPHQQGHLGTARVMGRVLHLYAEDGQEWTSLYPFRLAAGDALHITLPCADHADREEGGGP